jgi:antirestriction protein ArdC
MITHSKHARSILKTALKNRDLIVRAVDGNAYYDPSNNSINVDPKYHPGVQTADGPEPAPTTAILGHELGHGAGAKDDGPNNMNNVIENENPIRRDLGLPDRTQYAPPGST